MDSSVKINGISYNGQYALTLGKKEWSEETKADFGGDAAKAGEAYDSIEKELKQRETDEQKEVKEIQAKTNEQAAAQKKLEARGKTVNEVKK